MKKFFKSVSDRLFFGVVDGLVRQARSKILQESDLLDLPRENSPQTQVFRADRLKWTDSRALVWSLLPAGIQRLRKAYIFYAISLFLGLGQPVLVNRFIGILSGDLDLPENFRMAMILAVSLAGLAILRGLLTQHYFYGTLVAFQWAVNALNEKIFRHALGMTQAARLKAPVGDIVNYMGSDSESVGDFNLVFAELVWSFAMVIGVAVMLFVYIGTSAFVPLALLALLAPGTRWAAKKFSKLDEEMMHHRDRRVTLMNQILNAIRVVKFFAWEKSVAKEVADVRDREIHARRRMARAETFSTVTYVGVSSIVLFSALLTHTWRGFTLDPALVFTCVSLFGLLEEPFGSLSFTLSRFANSFVSAGRITDFLKTPTLKDLPEKPDSDEPTLSLQVQGLESFGGQQLLLKAGESLALVGPVGGGKSMFLAALLGELVQDREKISYLDSQGRSVSARTAYVPQEAYIINGSLLENLTFGTDGLTPSDIKKAIQAANFETDLRDLPAGLRTEIGEKGVNLSGGQKQRVSLARAYLRHPQAVFLDDPLSAVDVETEQRLCERLLFGEWKNITRVVATHRLENLRRFDRILFIENGKISAQGTYDQVFSGSERFQRFIRDHEKTQGVGHGISEATAQVPVVIATESRITEDEDREVGAVKSTVYADYFMSLGGEKNPKRNLAFLLMGAVSVMALPLLQRWWLGFSSTVQKGGEVVGAGTWLLSTSFSNWIHDPMSSVYVYGILGLLALGLSLMNSLMWLERGIQAGQLMHDRMLKSMLGASVRFFDSTPVGRILQRFSRDVESVDIHLQRSFDGAIHVSIEVILCLTLILVTVPLALIAIAPILFIYYGIQRDYRRPAREAKRFDSVARSPRYAHFKETLVGLPVIRGFRREQWFLDQFFAKLTYSQRMFYNHFMLNRWFSSRVPLIGGLIAVSTTAGIVFSVRAGNLTPGTAGLLTIYMLSFWGFLNWGIRIFADIESRMTSIERLRVYASLPGEMSTAVDRKTKLSESWPRSGELVLEHVAARYAPHLPLVLKDVSFRVESGQRVGLIGRTGSGKSTLFQTLFRFVELESGKILFDGEEIASVPLERLRRNMAIIPQDPTLFMGTIRSNLDRYAEYPESDLIEALKKASMWDFVSALPGKLDFSVVENGLNLSQGQRQLLCLARALLTKAKVIVFDEATASVDVETDALLQKVIHESLEGVTLLIIAHRLGTVADCHKVIELANGQVVRELSPREVPASLIE